jgi:hypothetical protein
MTEITPDKATVAPTDKSIPPVKITIVIPAAKIAIMETCFNTFNKLAVSKKFGAVNESTTHNNNKIMIMPSLFHKE